MDGGDGRTAANALTPLSIVVKMGCYVTCILSQLKKEMRPRFTSNSFLSPKALQEFRPPRISISTSSRGSSTWVQSHQTLLTKLSPEVKASTAFLSPCKKEWLHCPWTTWFLQVQFIYKQTMCCCCVQASTDVCEEGLQVRRRWFVKDQMPLCSLPDESQAPPGRSFTVWYVFKNSHSLNLKC